MANGKITVAVLDGECRMRLALSRLLKAHGFEVDLYESGEVFFQMLPSIRPDCLLLDLHTPELTGFDVLQLLASKRPLLPVIVITGFDEPKTAERVRSLGAADYLLKPIDEFTLVDAIRRVCPNSSPGPLGDCFNT